jgi:hypothetical protein
MRARPTAEPDGRLWLLATALAIGVSCAVASQCDAPEHAAGAVAVRIVPRTEAEFATALALADDVWSEDISVGAPLVVAVAPSRLDPLRAAGGPTK